MTFNREQDSRSFLNTDLSKTEPIDPIKLYLKEISATPLLTKEQELELVKKIETAKKASQERSKTQGKITTKRKQILDGEIRAGRLAKNHLIKANTRLVVSIAKKYMGRGIPLLDLIQEGNVGLMRAVGKYDYHRGFRFSTYATWWVRQAIDRLIANFGRTIRVPVHMIDHIHRLYKTAHLLEQQMGRRPSAKEIAVEMGEDVKKVEMTLKASRSLLSLDSPVGDSDDSELGMFIEDDKSPNPSELATYNIMMEKISEVIDTIPSREARVVRLRFGLDGPKHTLQEVGDKLGLTRERIRQIEDKALKRLRHPSKSRQLREFLE